MHRKPFGTLGLVLLAVGVVTLSGGSWYYIQHFVNQKTTTSSLAVDSPATSTVVSGSSPTQPLSPFPSELAVIASLKADWPTLQVLIPFRPAYHNLAENAKGIWSIPTKIQFINKNSILVGFEDDNNPHIAILNFNGSRFSLLQVLRNQGDFAVSEWQGLVKKYGDPSYPISTYATSLVRNKQIVSFQDLTKVPENIFIRNYWESSSSN